MASWLDEMLIWAAGLSEAGVNLHFPQTRFAVDGAAPMEFAHAPLRSPLPMALVASIAAQQVAPVDGFWRLQ